MARQSYPRATTTARPDAEFDGVLPSSLISNMTDEIIDITRYLKREAKTDIPRGAMALWGAEGERARFALPLWRIIFLAEAERGVILHRSVGGGPPTPFVALDLARDPARTDLSGVDVPKFSEEESHSLLDREADGVIVHLGSRSGRVWSLLVDGGGTRTAPLPARTREDILFLAGECAGLLFLRDLSDDPDFSNAGEPPDD